MTTLTIKTEAKSSASRIPMIQTGQAIQSLRDSGYDLSAAIAEVVDNSIEANANNISIELIEGAGKEKVSSILFIDDGGGMDVETLHHYLVLGFSTRWMRTDTIGKYGVGAKLAALNFARRIDVWSRQSASEPWLHVHFDLDEARKAEDAGHEDPFGIDAPVADSPPKEAGSAVPVGTGTIVLWSTIDRLEHGRLTSNFDQLLVEVQKETSRTFREFLDGGIKIRLNGTELLPHDPLFLMKDTWADEVLTKLASEKPKGGGRSHFPALPIATREVIAVRGGKAYLTVTLYPKEVTRKRGMGGDELAKRLRVPDNEGAVSFMRSRREIAYTNVPRIFPRGVQEADRFIGIEVSFTPELDDYFGVRNVKRGVEPHGDLRDKIRARLAIHIPAARKRLEERWGETARAEQTHAGEHSSVTDAVKDVESVLPKGPPQPATDEKRQKVYEELAKDTGHDKTPQQKEDYINRLRELPFVVESVDYPGKMFIDVEVIDRQIIIRLNTRHRFYQELWKPLHELGMMGPGAVSGDDAVKAARRAVEGLSLMIIAYGKAMSMDESGPDKYTDLTMYWGQFIDTLMGKVKGVV
jgi:hypothetical protein